MEAPEYTLLAFIRAMRLNASRRMEGVSMWVAIAVSAFAVSLASHVQATPCLANVAMDRVAEIRIYGLRGAATVSRDRGGNRVATARLQGGEVEFMSIARSMVVELGPPEIVKESPAMVVWPRQGVSLIHDGRKQDVVWLDWRTGAWCPPQR